MDKNSNDVNNMYDEKIKQLNHEIQMKQMTVVIGEPSKNNEEIFDFHKFQKLQKDVEELKEHVYKMQIASGEINLNDNEIILKDSTLDENNSEAEEVYCMKCFLVLDSSEGIILRKCLHTFCINCFLHKLNENENGEVFCPVQIDNKKCLTLLQDYKKKLSDENFNSIFIPNETVTNQTEMSDQITISMEEFENSSNSNSKIIQEKDFINKKNNFSLNKFEFNSNLIDLGGFIIRCKKPDCDGGGFIEANEKCSLFVCPTCNSYNCRVCQAIHTGMTCVEYKNGGNNKSKLNEKNIPTSSCESNFCELKNSSLTKKCLHCNETKDKQKSVESKLQRTESCGSAEWICDGCKYKNGIHKFICQKCKEPKERNKNDVLRKESIRYEINYNIVEENRMREWKCDKCNILNKTDSILSLCDHCGELDEGRKRSVKIDFFHSKQNTNQNNCPNCNTINCLHCEAIHPVLNCDKYQNTKESELKCPDCERNMRYDNRKQTT